MTHSRRKRRAKVREAHDGLPKCPYHGKVRYADMASAVIARDALRAQGRRERTAYPCRECGGWHLTSQRK